MPKTSGSGDVRFQNRRLQLKYEHLNGRRLIQCHFSEFYDGKDLIAELTLDQPEMDTICIATPWKEKPTAFYYNQKINCLPASGIVMLGDDTYEFHPDRDAGVLDWGRGVWTYDNTWFWGTGSGFLNGDPFGFNLGYGFTDRSSASENVIFYRNRAHKLDEVTFRIPKKADKSRDYMKEWHISSSDGRLRGVFFLVLNRHADLNVLVIATCQNQVFGALQARLCWTTAHGSTYPTSSAPLKSCTTSIKTRSAGPHHFPVVRHPDQSRSTSANNWSNVI